MPRSSPNLAIHRMDTAKSDRKVAVLARRPNKGQQSSTWCLAGYALSTVERSTPWTSRLSGILLGSGMLGQCYMSMVSADQSIE